MFSTILYIPRSNRRDLLFFKFVEQLIKTMISRKQKKAFECYSKIKHVLRLTALSKEREA
jgi:hypothetical protein